MNRSASATGASNRPPWRNQRADVRRTVGVVNEKANGFGSRRPDTLAAVVSIVTVYRVAYGSGAAGSGVKIRIVVPDQRHAPFIAGVI